MSPSSLTETSIGPPAGSSAYYALQRCPRGSLQALRLLLDVHVQVRSVVTKVSDAAVAQAKLAWWQAQIEALDQGRPADHPSLRALAPHLQTQGLQPGALLGVTESVAIDLRQNRWMDRAALLHYCRVSSGQTLRNTAALLGLTSPAALDAAEELGCGLRLTSIIRHLGRDVAEGRVYLPLDVLQEHGVTAAQLQQRALTPPIRALLESETRRAQAALRAARQGLAPYPIAQTAPLIAIAAQYATLLREIERADYAVLHQRISLTPLRKLWISRSCTWRRGG